MTKWYSKASVQTAIIGGLFGLILASGKTYIDYLNSKEKIILTDVLLVPGITNSSHNVEFRLKNDGGGIGTINRLIIKIIDFKKVSGESMVISTNQKTLGDDTSINDKLIELGRLFAPDTVYSTAHAEYEELSHTYSNPVINLSKNGKINQNILYPLSQKIAPGDSDRFRVEFTTNMLHDEPGVQLMTWVIQPTLITSRGELRSETLTLTFSNSGTDSSETLKKDNE